LGSEARARLALAGLLAVTLLGFSQLFAAGDFTGPILLGMLIAASIAIGSRRLGIGTGLTVLISAGVLVFYLSFIFETQHTFYGLPTPRSIDRLVEAISHSIDQSRFDFAPVPVRTGYVVMVVSGMWIAATVGEIATFRWKRPLTASMPAIALMATVLVVGTGQAAPVLVVLFLSALLTYWGLESAHRLRSWGRWVPTWAGHVEEVPASVTGSIARRMGAGCVLAAVVAPLFLPAINSGLLAWRSGIGEGPGDGVAGGGRVDPFVSIAPSLLNQTDERLFTVRTDRPSYWRLVTLSAFDGEQWSPALDSPEPASDGVVENLDVGISTRVLEQQFEIDGLEGDNLPAAVQATEVSFADADKQARVRYGFDTGDLTIEDGVESGYTYTVTSEVPEVTYSEMLAARPLPPEEAGIHAQLPRDALSEAVLGWLAETIEAAEADSAYEELVAIQNRLRSDEYSYSVPTRSPDRQQASTDHLEEFLLSSKTGYCQQFAGAFAVLARARGYPTRIVVGFLPGELALGSDDKRIVRGTDAHAWPEVYFPRYGWIPFEPTPRSEPSRIASPPVYTQPATATGANNPELRAGSPDLLPQERGFDPRTLTPEERCAASGLGCGETDPPAGALPPGLVPRAPGPRGTPPWVKTFTRVTVAVSALTLLFLIAIPVLKESRIRRAYTRAASTRDLAAAAFNDFAVNAAELASPRRAPESAAGYARRVAELGEIPDRPLLRLASIFEASEYAPTDPSSEEAAEAKRLAQEIRARLWRNSTWWAKALRLFSPASL
jgi:transglutaminase-like putative cysteine protease